MKKQYRDGNRDDLADTEAKELEILNEFLPDPMSEEEIIKIIMNTINECGAENMKDMGKVMGTLKKDYSDTLDFSKAGSYLKEALNKK